MNIDLTTIDLCPGQGGGGISPSGTLTILENGMYDVYSYASASVSVPIPTPITESLTVSVNNTYYPGQDVDGFSMVVVDVPQSVTGYTEKEITEGVSIVNLNNSASFVCSYALYGNQNIHTVNLPNASYVGIDAFANCTNLTYVDLPTCEYISANAFSGCFSLSQVNIPELKSVASYAWTFAYCSVLEKVDFPKLSFVGSSMFKDCSNMSQVSLPEVTFINHDGFNGCEKLTSVYIPKCTSFTGQGVFGNCKTLQDFDMTNIQYITRYAFQNCYLLSQAILTNCMSLDSNNVFQNCSSLELLSFGNNYMKFSYNNILTGTKIARGIGSIYVPDYNYSWYITTTGWSSLASRFVSYETSGSPLNYSNGSVYGSTSFIDYSFTSVLGISYMDVTSFDLPECYNILTQPGYNDRFPTRECKNLQNVNMGLSYVKTKYFSQLSKLQNISLPNCTHIERDGFVRCSSLSQIYIPLCDGVKASAFNNCFNLQSIDLPVCSYIENGGFTGCYSLSQINIPLCEYISWNAFTNCYNLQSIDLPVCSYIENGAFVGCSSLSQVYLRSNSVCSLLGGAVFDHGPMVGDGSGSIFVPTSLVDAYKSAQYWSSMSSRIFSIPE